MLKQINLELERALLAKDKVHIERAARKLELYLDSANIALMDAEELQRALRLGREADDVLRGVTSPRFRHTGFKFGIGRKLTLGPSPEQRLRSALVTAKKTALLSSRGTGRVTLETIPKIIHCTWAGGGAIDKVKSLDGIKSWLRHTDYKVFVWWDSQRLFNMHVRRLLRSSHDIRRLYDDSSTKDTLGIRDKVTLGIRDKVTPGSNRHNHRFLAQLMDKEGTFEMTKELWDEIAHDLHPLEELAEAWPDRLLLADVRSKALEGRIDWHNLELYERELTLRGMFAAAASDILRYEILYNFGGVYMDVDIELTGDLGTLRAHPDLLLAGITPDRAGKPCYKRWEGRDRIEATINYWMKCFYISNCIVAACPGSRAMQAVRETVGLAYACMEKTTRISFQLDPKRLIRNFWDSDITRSTLDLTGPNVVREVLLQVHNGSNWDAIPYAGIKRLVQDLTEFHGKKMPKDFDDETFRRVAYVWRDDHRAHLDFWKWISTWAVFPMKKIACDTDAAERSDCRTASTQVRREQLKKVQLRKLNPYFPNTGKEGEISGVLSKLHTQYKQSEGLPSDLKPGQILWWGHARWQVVSITKDKGKKPLPESKWSIRMKMLV